MVLDEYKTTGLVFDVLSISSMFDRYWPYEYSRWQQHAYMMENYGSTWFGDNEEPEVLKRIKLAHERYRRRLEKKTLKLRKAERKGRHGRIPGAWID